MADREGKAQGGTILHGSDGSIYFIRDEVLPAFKAEGEALQRIHKEMAGKPEAGAKPAQGVAARSYLTGDLLGKDPPAWSVYMPRIQSVDVERIRTSTVMCPWFC
jgi:hypothetical protein